jgi:dihydroneopterin aldolase
MVEKRKTDLTVVKFGGSHAFQTHLRAWLNALAECGGRAMVVPGGGPFADQVRLAQKTMAFGDQAAHHMALLAMEQFGVAMCGLEPRLVPAASLRALRAALSAGRTPVWMASKMALAAAELEQSWDLTSDSLAAWLAAQVGARRVVLVKHGAPIGCRPNLGEFAKQGIIDPLLARYLDTAEADVVFLGPADHARLGEAIHAAAPCLSPDSVR